LCTNKSASASDRFRSITSASDRSRFQLAPSHPYVHISLSFINNIIHICFQLFWLSLNTRSSAVAQRPHDATCLYCFYTLEWCGYPMMNKFKHMFIRFDMIHEREKIAVYTYRSPHFLFPLETPLRLSRNMLHGWKDNSMLAKPLAVCTYLSSTVSELYDA